LDFGLGPFYWGGFDCPFSVGYSRTSESQLVRLKLRGNVQRKDIKVHLLEGGILETQRLRHLKGKEVPVE
jgi:hypothetical protein